MLRVQTFVGDYPRACWAALALAMAKYFAERPTAVTNQGLDSSFLEELYGLARYPMQYFIVMDLCFTRYMPRT